MTNKSTKLITKFHLTDRTTTIIIGVLLSFLLIVTPFLFYLYKYAPSDSKVWDTAFGIVESGEFRSVQTYLHALFTKITFVLITTIWFLTSKNWWKYAILVPLTMFLFQLSGVINYKIQYIDEFDFWYSLPVILPIIILFTYISYSLGKVKTKGHELKKEMDENILNVFSDKL